MCVCKFPYVARSLTLCIIVVTCVFTPSHYLSPLTMLGEGGERMTPSLSHNFLSQPVLSVLTWLSSPTGVVYTIVHHVPLAHHTPLISDSPPANVS